MQRLAGNPAEMEGNMYRNGRLVLALAVLGMAGCAESSTSPRSSLHPTSPTFAKSDGTGLVLDNVTGITLPLIGEVGNVVVKQTNLTHLVLVEDAVGNVIGLQAEGVLALTGGVLGTDVVTQHFLTQVNVASSGPGRCDVLTVDLGPITVDALGSAVSVDLPQAAVTPRASGALGSLLCNLGRVLQQPVNGATSAVRGLVNAINQLLI
jgi:hypothetical protein